MATAMRRSSEEAEDFGVSPSRELPKRRSCGAVVTEATKGDTVAGEPTIHRFPIEHEGAFVNAYLVETDSGVVAVDGLLTVSAAIEMREAIDGLGKPLHAALVTHSHPDHYAGLAGIVAGADVPIVAPQGVIDTISADDATKDQLIGPMFGKEWPTNRIFPNTPIRDGESLTFDDVTFTVIDLGPSESPHDSPWVLGEDEQVVFLGDQIYDHRHCYLADGFYAEWLENIEMLRARFSDDAVFYIGHGGPVRSDMWDWQRGYIETFLDAVADADWSEAESAKATVVTQMKAYEPSDELQVLMELSIEPIAAKQGLLSAAAG
jgi:glyoxylase-like metal-dependent hydrolase (beta-lactamase superfamily II)